MKKRFLFSLSFLISILSLPKDLFSQNVGIGTATPHASAQLEISSTNKGLLPPRMDSTQRNAISSPAVGLVIYNTSIKGLECWNGTKWYSTVHYIGERYGGGIVFFVYDGGQHGLIAAATDINAPSTTDWGSYVYTRSTANGIGAGLKNTVIIIAVTSALVQTIPYTTVATLCNEYSVIQDGVLYGDWYLPSKYELNLLYLKKNVVGGFSEISYWSSTEFDNNQVWIQQFFDGLQQILYKDDNQIYIRAIRSF